MARRNGGGSGLGWLALAAVVAVVAYFTFQATVGVPAGFLSDFFAFIGTPFRALGGVLGDIWGGVTSAASGVWDGVTDAVGGIWDAVTFWD